MVELTDRETGPRLRIFVRSSRENASVNAPALIAECGYALRTAAPLICACLVAEICYTSPNLSGNVLAFAGTWLALDYGWRRLLRFLE